MIRLTVISTPDAGVASGFTMVFGPGGGTIGRSHDNTWRLTDPECLVSRTHAEIHFGDGQYIVTDKSTNGLFINHSEAPLGYGNTSVLRHGDRLRLGLYTLGIALETDRVTCIDSDLGPADFLSDNIPVLTPLPQSASTHATAQLASDSILSATLPAPALIPPYWSFDMSLPEHANSTTPPDMEVTLDLEHQLRLALKPFAGNMVMDFNQRELLALITYLVGRAKHANTTSI